MKIAVFGAGGYIGIPLCEALAANGHEVVAVDRWFFGKQPAGGGIRIVQADTRWSVAFDGMDAVVDLAGLSNDAAADIAPALTEQINCTGGKRLASGAKAHGVRRYVYSSSASVYGAGERLALTEVAQCNPLTAYAKSKLEVERHIRGLQDERFEAVILRNATVFGVAPRMRFDLAVNIMTLRAWRDNTIYVMGGGQQWRPFVHISDVVRAFVIAVEGDEMVNQTWNIGDDRLNMPIASLALLVHAEYPEAKIHAVPDDIDRRSYNVSFAKIKALGFEMTRDVQDGIDEIGAALKAGYLTDDPTCYTVQWYKSLLEWDERLNKLKMGERLL